jgi:hypothetical protein
MTRFSCCNSRKELPPLVVDQLASFYLDIRLAAAGSIGIDKKRIFRLSAHTCLQYSPTFLLSSLLRIDVLGDKWTLLVLPDMRFQTQTLFSGIY